MGKYKDKNYFIFDKKDSLLLVNDNEELVLGKDEDIVFAADYADMYLQEEDGE